jgi:peptide/nickel transport system substrate-binding protein
MILKGEGMATSTTGAPQATGHFVKHRLGLAVLLSALILAGTCAAGASTLSHSSAPTPKRGGSLTIIASGISWVSLDPANTQDGAEETVQSLLYDSLFNYNSKGQLVDSLAQSFKYAAGGSSVTIVLRKNLKFQDGTPINAAAAVTNLDRYASTSLDSECATYFAQVSSIVATGPLTVTISFSKPYSPFIAILATLPCGMMASPTALQAEGNSFGVNPVGSGPYKFVSEVPNVSIQLTRSSNYWQKGEQYIKNITYETVSSDSVAMEAMQSGGAQVFYGGVFPIDVAQAKTSHLVDESTPGITVDHMQFNFTQAPFTNPLAREAVIEATNPESIVTNLYDKAYSTTESPLGPGSWGYPGSKVPGYPKFNLAGAQALVQQLGGLSFTLVSNNTPAQVLEDDAVAAQLQSANINVTVSPVGALTLINDFQHKTYQAALNAYGVGPDPDLTLNRLFNSTSILNSQKFSNPAVDVLLNRAAETFSQPQRKSLYTQVLALLTQNYVWDALYVATPHMILSKRVHNLPITSVGNLALGSAWLS